MRLIVPYRDAAFHAATSLFVPPPEHIRVDAREVSQDNKIITALNCLERVPDINTCILEDQFYREGMHDYELRLLDGTCAGRGITILIPHPNSTRIQHEIEKGIMQRIERARARFPNYAFEQDIGEVVKRLSAHVARIPNLVRSEGSAEVVTSYLTYMPDYLPRKNGTGILNVHVDRQTNRPFDVRIVEAKVGNATGGFANRDFRLVSRGGEEYRQPVIEATNESKRIDCWMGSGGSIFMMRAPSCYTFRQGATPGIHAAGLPNEFDLRRWTITHDIRYLEQKLV